MSKLLRLPFALLAVLALFLLTPLSASADPPDTPTAQQCADDPGLEGCGTPEGEDAGAAGDLTGTTDEVVPPPQNKVTLPQGLDAEPLALPPVPCDAVPGIGLPDCAPPNCDALPSDLFPDCDPAAPPSCDRLPELPGLPFCQFPDGDCPPPTATPTAAAVTDGECTPPLSCDQFAQLFGFGDSCEDIPLCIPRDRVPPGFPLPIPSPPLCGAGAGGTPPPTQKPPTGGGTSNPGITSPGTSVYYANCDDARAHGASNIPRDTPGYRPELDSDNDGIACETDTHVAVATAQPTGTLAYTGVDVEGLIRLGAILIAGGTLVLLAGVRREA